MSDLQRSLIMDNAKVSTVVMPLAPLETIASTMLETQKVSLAPDLNLFSPFSSTETWHGTHGDDYKNYTGSNHLNAYGYGGNDFIWGGSGDDVIDGGSGNDTLKGWYGNDVIYGGEGHDSIYGEYGNDYLYGESGNDYMVGGSGNDYMDGGSGHDTMLGNEGNDTLIGGKGNDDLYGGEGNDRLNGYGFTVNNDSQFDNLYGGKGADTFVLGGFWGVSYDETGDGYAVIKDFDWREGDKIEVKGDASQYVLEYKSVSGIGSSAMDTEIYYLHADGSRDRIGIVEDKSGLEVLKGADFSFV